ncbi:MAG: PorV/PorQ family protein [Elusimicrobia bacterium]|nr:PorV/PorQ family protein [Elusimicrobiota bacterium]
MIKNRKSEVGSRNWKTPGSGKWEVGSVFNHSLLTTAYFLILTTYYLLLTTYGLPATPGTSGAQFLNIPVSARSSSLGEAYTGYGEDSGIIEYNPAGLGNIFTNELSLSHLAYFELTTLQSITITLPTRKFAFGLNGKYLNSKDTTRDIYGTDGSDFYIIDWSVMGGFAYKVTADFSLGLSVRNISQKLKDRVASGASFGLGAFTVMPRQKVSLGISVVNIGQGIRFIDERDPLPITLKMGGSWGITHKTTLLVEVIQPNDGGLKQRLGLEYHITEPFWLRFGWKINQRKFDDYTGITCGFGLRFGKFYLDYAFVPHSDLGVSHYVSTSIKFGKPLPLPKSRTEKLDEEPEPDASSKQKEEGTTEESTDTEQENQ